MKTPLVTAIVSTYRAERFILGCLQDLASQTLFSEMEVLVIDSGSPERESEISEAFARQHPQVRVLRTAHEPLYTAWNRALPLARGKYLTNANTDDRHRDDFAEVLVQALERQPAAALAYADQLLSHTVNETFAECAARGAQMRRWPDYAPAELMLRCITGSQPMWRRALHDELGGFDTRYKIAADYDMWLRMASGHALVHVAQALGSFYDAADTLSGRNHRLQMDEESLAIKQLHMARAPWKTLPALRKRLAAETFGTGYRHLSGSDRNRAARPFLREAIRLDPLNLRYFKTYLVRGLLGLAPS